MSEQQMPLQISTVGDVTVVAFREPSIIDPLQIQQVGDQLYALVDEGGQRKIVIDFANVKFLSSQTLAVLMTLRKKSDAIDGIVCVSGLKTDLHKVFKITKLDSFFDFYPTPAEALAALGGEAR